MHQVCKALLPRWIGCACVLGGMTDVHASKFSSPKDTQSARHWLCYTSQERRDTGRRIS